MIRPIFQVCCANSAPKPALWGLRPEGEGRKRSGLIWACPGKAATKVNTRRLRFQRLEPELVFKDGQIGGTHGRLLGFFARLQTSGVRLAEHVAPEGRAGVVDQGLGREVAAHLAGLDCQPTPPDKRKTQGGEPRDGRIGRWLGNSRGGKVAEIGIRRREERVARTADEEDGKVPS